MNRGKTVTLFAINKDIESQIGYFISFTNIINKVNTIYWFSIKCKQVICSVLVAELYRIAYGFDIGIIKTIKLEKVLRSDVLLIVFTDLKSLYDCLVK